MSDETETETIVEQMYEKPKKNKGGRPRKAVVAAPMLSDEQFAQLLGAIANANASNGLNPELLKEALAGAAVAAATHTAHTANPSNTNHPGISAFNYPEGEAARPKPVPPFAFWYNGYPCTKAMETEHWRECELMCEIANQGVFPIIRKDGSKMNVTVMAERDVNGALEKVEVFFGERDKNGNFTPIPASESNLVPPKAVVLYQIVHAGTRTPRQLFVEAMTEWLNIALGDSVAA